MMVNKEDISCIKMNIYKYGRGYQGKMLKFGQLGPRQKMNKVDRHSFKYIRDADWLFLSKIPTGFLRGNIIKLASLG